MNAPVIRMAVTLSCKTSAPVTIDVTVAIPIKDEIRLTPVLETARFDRKNAATEQPIPW